MWILYIYKYIFAVCPAGGVMSDPYDVPMGRLLRFVCENPHIAKDVLWAIDYLNPDEIFDQLTSPIMEES